MPKTIHSNKLSTQRLKLKSQNVEEIINNRGLAYGDGFFSTMGVYQGQILWAAYHKKRLTTHAKALQLTININRLMQNLCNRAQQMGEGVLKVVINRQSQSVRGYGFDNGNADFLVKSTPMAIYSDGTTSSFFEEWEGLITLDDASLNAANMDFMPLQPPITAICLTSQIACLPKPLVGLKTLNRLDNVLACAELIQKQQFAKNRDGKTSLKIGEGLTQNVMGEWVEGTMSNVFYQLKSSPVWYTPPIDKSGVNGVMRQVLMELPAIDITERKLSDEDLSNISAMFFTNAVRGVIPVNKLMLLSGAIVDL